MRKKRDFRKLPYNLWILFLAVIIVCIGTLACYPFFAQYHDEPELVQKYAISTRAGCTGWDRLEEDPVYPVGTNDGRIICIGNDCIVSNMATSGSFKPNCNLTNVETVMYFNTEGKIHGQPTENDGYVLHIGEFRADNMLDGFEIKKDSHDMFRRIMLVIVGVIMAIWWLIAVIGFIQRYWWK